MVDLCCQSEDTYSLFTLNLCRQWLNKDREASRPRNIRRRRKRELEKYKAFYNYVFTQELELGLCFETKQAVD